MGQTGFCLSIGMCERSTHHPALKCWISSCLLEAFHSNYCHFGMEHEMLCANPHLIWGVAASWAQIARVPVSEICRVTTWLNTCTFAQIYLLNFIGWWFWFCHFWKGCTCPIRAQPMLKHNCNFSPLPIFSFAGIRDWSSGFSYLTRGLEDFLKWGVRRVGSPLGWTPPCRLPYGFLR